MKLILLFAFSFGVSAVSSFNAATASESTCSSLSSSEQAEWSAGSGIQSVAAEIESAGGKGVHFKSVSPFSAGSACEDFYLLLKAPPFATVSSALFLFRIENSRTYVQKLLDDGVPIILGNIPQSSGVVAAAMGDRYILSQDAAVARTSQLLVPSHGALLIQTTANRYELLHEHQHWLDYDPKYSEKYARAIFPFSAYFTKEQRDSAWRITWEMRAHWVQSKAAHEDRLNGVQVVNRAGTIYGFGDSGYDSAYDFVEGDAISAFMNAYWEQLPEIFSRVIDDPKLRGDYCKAMEPFDFSEEVSNPLTYRNFFKIYN